MTKRLKRIIAFLSAVALLVTTVLGTGMMKGARAAESEPTPVTLEGFETITIDNIVDAAGNSMPTGSYAGSSSGAHDVFYVKDCTNLDKKLLTLKVLFEGGEYKHSLIVGGNGGWCGFNIHPNSDGSALVINNSWAGEIATYSPITLAASTAGVSSFIDNELLLQISFAYGEVVDGKADLALGFYINGVLYGNNTVTISSCNMSKAGNVFALYREEDGSAIVIKSATEKVITPVTLEGYTDITIKDFSNNGTQMPSGEFKGLDISVGGNHQDYSVTNLANFNKVLLSAKVILNGATYKNRLDLGGNAGWTGFSLQANASGSQLEFRSNYGITTTAAEQMPNIVASAAGITSFLNNEFILQLSFDYGEIVNNRADLTLGVYINGELYNDAPFVIKDCDMTKTGSHLAYYGEDANSSIFLYSIDEEIKEPDEEETPDEDEPEEVKPAVVEGFDTISVEHFVDSLGNPMQTGAYAGASTGAHNEFVVKDLANLHKKLLSMKVTFEGGSYKYSLIVGGNGGWCGFNVHPNSDGSSLVIDNAWAGDITNLTPIELKAVTAGVTSFVGEEMILQMSFEYGEEVNGKADLTLGVYINGKLYENKTFTIANCNMSKSGACLGLYREVDGSNIIIDSINDLPDEPDQPEGPTEPETPNPNLKAYTYKNFGLKEKTYHYSGDFAALGALKAQDTLANTIVGGDILLTGGEGFQIIFGGKNSGWDGLRLISMSGRLDLYWYQGKTGIFIESLYPETAGVSAFVGEKYNLKLSTEVNGDSMKFGIWFNDVLYGNKYYNLSGRNAELGNQFGVYCANSGDQVVLGNPSPEDEDGAAKKPNASFTQLTFGHFKIKDGTYAYNGDIVAQGTWEDKESLNKTVVQGDILLTGDKSFQILYGGDGNVWNGVRLITTAQAMHVYWFQGNDSTLYKSIMPTMVDGNEFVGKEMNLKVSMELVDDDDDGKKNDIKLGIWINDIFCGDDYIMMSDKGSELGNMFGVYCEDPNGSVTLNSIAEIAPEPEPLKKPNKDFRKTTFTHYGLEDGTYKCDGTTAPTFEGMSTKDVNRTVLCGDIRINGIGDTHLMFGGKDNCWYSFRFVQMTNGNIALYWIDEEGMTLYEIFDAFTAGTSLVDTWFNLKISTEIVDADGDGNEDDISLGVWFNDLLYQNKYITVLDKADRLGKWFGFDCATEGTSVSVKSIPELIEGFDYSVYGLTEDWENTLLKTGMKAGLATGGSQDAKPFSGDLLESGKVFFWMLSAVAALAAGIYVVMQRKRKEQ